MFTKGPWKLIDDCIRSPDMAGISDQMADYRGAIICDMSAGLGHSLGERYLSRRHALPETRANAHLIAAAPDLYWVCKYIEEDGLMFNSLNRDVAKMLQAALAKVEDKS